MSKRDELLDLYASEFKKMNISFDSDLLSKVTVGLGPSIYNKDSSTVSCSDSTELQRVIDNFLVKKLGLNGKSNDELMDAVKDVCNTLGSSNKNKYRAMFYYLLVKKFNKESAY